MNNNINTLLDQVNELKSQLKRITAENARKSEGLLRQEQIDLVKEIRERANRINPSILR
jgi:DNA-binding protein H-NS